VSESDRLNRPSTIRTTKPSNKYTHVHRHGSIWDAKARLKASAFPKIAGSHDGAIIYKHAPGPRVVGLRDMYPVHQKAGGGKVWNSRMAAVESRLLTERH
jgi:hypothetical protein